MITLSYAVHYLRRLAITLLFLTPTLTVFEALLTKTPVVLEQHNKIPSKARHHTLRTEIPNCPPFPIRSHTNLYMGDTHGEEGA